MSGLNHFQRIELLRMLPSDPDLEQEKQLNLINEFVELQIRAVKQHYQYACNPLSHPDSSDKRSVQIWKRVWSWDPSGELASRISEMIDEHAEKLRPGSIGARGQYYE